MVNKVLVDIDIPDVTRSFGVDMESILLFICQTVDFFIF